MIFFLYTAQQFPNFLSCTFITHVVDKNIIFSKQKANEGRGRQSFQIVAEKWLERRWEAESKGTGSWGYIERTMALQPKELDSFLVVLLISMLTPSKSFN